MRLLRLDPRPFLLLTRITLGLFTLNFVTGAAVRLSGSGLGCPDWPGCTRDHLTAPLAGHAGIEFANRLVVVLLSVATFAVLLGAWRRTPCRRDLTWLSAGLVLGVFAEALVGKVVVVSKLNPYVVAGHFLLGIALLALAANLVLRAGRETGPRPPKVTPGDVTLTRVLIGFLFVVLTAGAATTGTGPHAGGVGAKRIPVPLDDMVRTHSSLALTLGGLTLLLLWRLQRRAAPESVQARGRILLAVLLTQGVLGYTQFFLHLPPLLVGIHVLGAATVWVAYLWFHDGLFGAPTPTPAGDPPTDADALTAVAPAPT